MRRIVRLALIWVLSLVLPLQGVAAATMLSCEVHHVHSEALQLSEVPHDHMAMHHSQVWDVGGHEHVEPAHAHPGKPDPAKAAAHKCSACASCCLGAVVPTMMSSFEAITITERYAPLVSSALAAYVAEGLERPPRHFLA